MPDVEDITVENLDIGHFKVCDAVDDDVSGVILLSTCLRVEAGSIEDDSECRVRWYARRRIDE